MAITPRELALGLVSIFAFVAALVVVGWLRWALVAVWAACLLTLMVSVARKFTDR